MMTMADDGYGDHDRRRSHYVSLSQFSKRLTWVTVSVPYVHSREGGNPELCVTANSEFATSPRRHSGERRNPVRLAAAIPGF